MRLAAALGRSLQAGDVVLLYGELGAGKTCFVRGLARGLGIDPADVSSPTFVLVQEYGPAPDRPPLVHIDAYRLTSPEDLASAGVEDLLADEAVIALEWPERLGDDLPPARIEIRLEHAGDDARSIDAAAVAPADTASRLRTAWAGAVGVLAG